MMLNIFLCTFWISLCSVKCFLSLAQEWRPLPRPHPMTTVKPRTGLPSWHPQAANIHLGASVLSPWFRSWNFLPSLWSAASSISTLEPVISGWVHPIHLLWPEQGSIAGCVSFVVLLFLSHLRWEIVFLIWNLFSFLIKVLNAVCFPLNTALDSPHSFDMLGFSFHSVRNSILFPWSQLLWNMGFLKSRLLIFKHLESVLFLRYWFLVSSHCY